MVGFDIEPRPYPGQLVLQDVLTLHGSQFRNAACIVASPPCQKYSYMAMPWKRAKALAAHYRERIYHIGELNALFEACFRIQREASEAAGRYIPMVVENVKGAQPWVGPARAHFGSFYLWGDINSVGGSIVAGRLEFGNVLRPSKRSKNNGGSWFNQAHNTESGHGQNPDGRKLPEGNCKERRWEDRPVARLADALKTGQPGRSFQSVAVAGTKVASESGRRTDVANGVRFTTRDWGIEGTKQGGKTRRFSSKSNARKEASARIAMIPFPLAQHIARVFHPGPSRAE